MGIYLPNMEMPQGKAVSLIICSSGKVYYDGLKLAGTAVSVPAHGRLIDADAVAKMVLDSVNQEDAQGFMFTKIICQILKDAPTIIPADQSGDVTEMVKKQDGT